jgi:hypothetical protein
VWRFLKKLKIELPCNTVIPLLGICLKEYKSSYNKGAYTPKFTASLFTIAKVCTQPICPTIEE